MFRKQLILILAVLLSVFVVVVGLSVFSARAALRSSESVEPKELKAVIGPYYREDDDPPPDSDGLWFGPEIYSDTLCPGNTAFNSGFDITYTQESATLSGRPDGNIRWAREQEWKFGNDPAPPTSWGTTREVEIGHEEAFAPTEERFNNPSLIFPWTGYETHDRVGNVVKSWGEVTGWVNANGIPESNVPSNEIWACPDYYKKIGIGTPTYDYNCNTGAPGGNTGWIIRRSGDFGPVESHNGGYAREAPVESGTYYNCMRLD